MATTAREGFLPTAMRWIQLATWFGLVAGVIEVLVLVFRRYAMDRMIWTSMDLIWLGPFVYAVAFILPAIVLLVGAWLLPGLVTVSRGGFILALLAAAISVFAVAGGRLHLVAQALIALGIAFRVSQWVAKPGVEGTIRRSLTWMMAGLAVLAAGTPGLRRLRQIQAESALPPPPTGAKNVLLIIWDTVRGENLSLYGYRRPTTSHLDHIGDEGAVFDRAISTAPWTLSSHASMFTGQLTQNLSTTWRTPLDRTYPTLAEVLARHGYRTGGFTANLLATTRESGLDRGYLRYYEREFSLSHVFLSTTLGQRIRRPLPFNRGPLRIYPFKPGSKVIDDFLRWVDADRSRPFFGFLNFFDAHDPYTPPRVWRQRFATDQGKSDQVVRRRDAYDAAIAYLDQELGRLTDELKRRGLLDNTLLIVTSDHGEQFGEHGLHQHGNSLYLPLLQVPLVIRLPGAVPPARITDPVGLAELPATIMGLAGVDDDAFPGQSLARTWQRAEPAAARSDSLISGVPHGMGTPPEEPVSRGNMNSVIAGRYHYIVNGDGVEEFYDVISDPGELVNLARESLGQQMLPAYRATLRARVPARWLPPSPGMAQAPSPPRRE
jgi:arylsulfatase A-like enzyme